MGVSEEPVCIYLFRQNPVFTSLHLRSPVIECTPESGRCHSVYSVLPTSTVTHAQRLSHPNIPRPPLITTKICIKLLYKEKKEWLGRWLDMSLWHWPTVFVYFQILPLSLFNIFLFLFTVKEIGYFCINRQRAANTQLEWSKAIGRVKNYQAPNKKKSAKDN